MLFISLTSNSGAQSRARNTDHLDESLIAKIANGDKEALTELYSQTKAAVYGFALSILRNASDAEDVMQDTYIKIYMSAEDYLPQGKPMAWMLTITRNLSLMKLRAGKKTENPTDVAWDPPNLNDTMENRLDRLVLEIALNTLADEERQIVILHAVTGLKHREIAALLHIPLSTTLSKYHRALSKLKKLIKEGEQDER